MYYYIIYILFCMDKPLGCIWANLALSSAGFPSCYVSNTPVVKIHLKFEVLPLL